MSEKKKRSVLVVNGEALVGFDLGTTYSKAAFIDSHHLPRLVPLGGPEARGIDRYQMPSVGLLRSDRLIVGDFWQTRARDFRKIAPASAPLKSVPRFSSGSKNEPRLIWAGPSSALC
jgi:molecular chaperone DnaK (HSP70)